MNQQNYLAAIQKQQSLIRKLFTNRKRRSEVIDELTKERYDHLRGKFFNPDDHEAFSSAFRENIFYICGVSAESNYINSDRVAVVVHCRYVWQQWTGTNGESRTNALGYGEQSFLFKAEDNLDEIFAPLFVQKEKAVEKINGIYKDVMTNYLKKG